MRNAKEVVREIAERNGRDERWAWGIIRQHFLIDPEDQEVFYDNQIEAIADFCQDIREAEDEAEDGIVIIEMGFLPFGVDRGDGRAEG